MRVFLKAFLLFAVCAFFVTACGSDSGSDSVTPSEVSSDDDDGSEGDGSEKGSKDSKVKPKSDTGSLRYAWYKIELTDVDLTSPVSIVIRGQDTYMEATGTFTLSENGSVYLACDNLMEGNTLVNISGLTEAQRDFYDTPLNMIDD